MKIASTLRHATCKLRSLVVAGQPARVLARRAADSALALAVRAFDNDLYYFFRLSAFGATAVIPLLGAGSVAPQLPARRTAGLLAVAAAFHAFAYVHNDLCDLAVDRTEPRRAMYPLVRGTVAPGQALAVALVCVPLAFALHEHLVAPAPLDAHAPVTPPPSPSRSSLKVRALRDGEAGAQRYPKTHLALAFGLMTAYNYWGKRCPLPPLTDLVQALGWAALLRYGAAAAAPRYGANALTALLAAYEFLLIMMVNGLHGALRDLANDSASGARTTAILFGARAEADGTLRVPPALAAYAALLQCALVALPVWAAAANLAGHSRGTRLIAAGGVAAVEGATLAALAAAGRRGVSTEFGMAHLVLLLSAPVALVAPGLAPQARAALLAAHVAPLLTNGLTYDALRWALLPSGPR